MRTYLILAMLSVAAGCGGGSSALDTPDAPAGCPTGQHASNGQCVPDDMSDAPTNPPSERFASLCNKHLDDAGMQSFVLEWSTLGIDGCDRIGAYLEPQLAVAFTFSETRRLDGTAGVQFRPWRINNTVVAALAGLPNVEFFELNDQPLVTDLSAIGKMRTLQDLHVSGSGVHDFSFVRELNLFTFTVRNERVDSLVPLSSQVRLTELTLVDTGNADLSPIAGLTQLSTLVVTKNAVTSAAPVAGLAQLHSLTLDDNELSDVAPVAGLTELTELSLRDNKLTSLAPLTHLTHLQALTLSNNTLTDIAPLAGLGKLRSLAIDQNAITSFAPLTTLVELTTLNLNRTGLSSLDAIATNTKLVSLFISDNPVTDLAALNTTASQFSALKSG